MLLQHASFFSQLSNLNFDKMQGYWSIGTQYGTAYQSADVDSELGGWGTGISVGKNLYFNEDAWFSFDLRSKLFFATSKGLDGKANANIGQNEVLNGDLSFDYVADPGYIFNNYKNSLIDLSIEANTLFNSYRKTAGWFVNLTGGMGLGVYNTRMNLSNDLGDYAVIFKNTDQNASARKIRKQLKASMDGSYETQASGFTKNQLKLAFMPSVGLELGYDLNRYLTAYVGHQTIFSRGDHLDGNSLGDPNNDRLNFTHLGLQVNFLKNYKQKQKKYSYDTKTEATSAPKSVKNGYPRVEIVDPEIDWFNTNKPEIEVIANVQNIYSVLDISCMVNGKEVAFDYDKDLVKFFAELQRGTNVLKVQVRNDKGEARDIKRVIFSPGEDPGYEKEVDEGKPVIELIQPGEEDYYAPEDIFTIQAYLENIDNKEDIQLTANGMDLSSFKFDPDFGNLHIKVRLAKGKNSFLLTAFNSYGKTEKPFTIYYGIEPEPDDEVIIGDAPAKDADEVSPIDNNTKPFITILSPVDAPHYTLNDKVFFQAEVHGIASKDDIVFKINDIENKFFSFDKNNKIISDDIHLLELSTEIIIETRNEYGTARKRIEIKYGEKPVKEKPAEPVVKFIDFIDVGEITEDCFVNFKVQILEAVSSDNISLSMNDFNIRNFRYNENSGKMLFALYLDEGKNKIEINIDLADRVETATYSLYCGIQPDENEDGSDLETEIIDTSPAKLISVSPQTEHITEEQNMIISFRTAHISSADGIMIFLNNESITDFEFDPDQSDVKTMLNLKPGENEIIIRISNEYGEDERVLNYFYDEPFRTAPAVVINTPRNGYETDENTIIFRASVDYIKSIDQIHVLLNGVKFTDFNYNLEYGKVQGMVPLKLGKNTIEISAENRIGKTTEKISFIYQIEHIPAVMITGPKEGLEYRKSFAILTGIVQNIEDKRGIGVQINRVPFKSINFDAANQTISSKILLEKGENEIILTAKNEYGFASDTIHLFFRGAPEKPTITFIKPLDEDQSTDSALFNLEAEVLEISHSSQINLTVNGRNFEEIYYYKEEKVIKAEITLKRGVNDIKIVASNDTGQTSARTKIYYR